jgi:hypothetical protein
MINITKELKDGALQIRLAGNLDETSNLDQLIGAPQPEMQLFLKELKRINSIGVKSWIRYFQGAKSKGSKLKLLECSTAVVEQINLISNFSCGAEIESIYVPFCCTQCKSELVGLFKTGDLKRIGLKIPALKCSKCGGSAVFDDIPEEYFAFLSR